MFVRSFASSRLVSSRLVSSRLVSSLDGEAQTRWCGDRRDDPFWVDPCPRPRPPTAARCSRKNRGSVLRVGRSAAPPQRAPLIAAAVNRSPEPTHALSRSVPARPRALGAPPPGAPPHEVRTFIDGRLCAHVKLKEKKDTRKEARERERRAKAAAGKGGKGGKGGGEDDGDDGDGDGDDDDDGPRKKSSSPKKSSSVAAGKAGGGKEGAESRFTIDPKQLALFATTEDAQRDELAISVK